jgi:hypothetical protein
MERPQRQREDDVAAHVLALRALQASQLQFGRLGGIASNDTGGQLDEVFG